MIKRIFDFSSSLLGLVILFPLLILISFAIKIGSSGPILFLQKRVGKDGKQFILIKFRSMLINQQSNNTATAKGDDRITTIGVFLRKYKLDELPELWNVLKGEM
ncbi:MAG: sugar transferase, partial [Flavobacteriales bacterium]|nr:sugar transferase [Flavobacteriales bacterium]